MNEIIKPPIGVNIPKIEIPYDVYTLPSKSKLYSDIPPEIEMEYVTTKDQDLLTSPGILKSGNALDMLLKRKVRDKNINLDSLIRGDKNKLLLELRIASIGPDYTVELIDPKTDKPFTTTIDLSSLKVIELTENPDEKGEFLFELPKTKRKIKYRFLTSKEENDLLIAAENRASLFNSQELTLYTDRLKAQVMEIDGERNKTHISNLIDVMPIGDSGPLRKKMNETEPGVDLMVSITAPSGVILNKFIFITPNFFWVD